MSNRKSQLPSLFRGLPSARSTTSSSSNNNKNGTQQQQQQPQRSSSSGGGLSIKERQVIERQKAMASKLKTIPGGDKLDISNTSCTIQQTQRQRRTTNASHVAAFASSINSSKNRNEHTKATVSKLLRRPSSSSTTARHGDVVSSGNGSAQLKQRPNNNYNNRSSTVKSTRIGTNSTNPISIDIDDIPNNNNNNDHKHNTKSSSSSTSSNVKSSTSTSTSSTSQYTRPKRRGGEININAHTTTPAMALAASKARLKLNNNTTTNTSKSTTTSTKMTGKGAIASLLGTTTKNNNNNTLASLSTKIREEPLNDVGKQLDMEDYFRTLRNWDFLTDWNTQQQTQSQQPQSSSKNKQKKRKQQQQQQQGIQILNDSTTTMTTTTTRQIPDTFKNRSQYQKIWGPLCINEAKAQILSDATMDWKMKGSNNKNNHNRNNHNNNNTTKSSSSSSITIPVIGTIQSNDVYTTSNHISIIIRPEYKNQNQQRFNFGTNDLVVLVKEERFLTLAFQGNLHNHKMTNNSTNNNNNIHYDDENNNNHHHHYQQQGEEEQEMTCNSLIGQVEYSRRTADGLRLKVSKLHWRRICQHNNEKEEHFLLWKLGGNVTSIREFSALCRVGMLPLLPYLLCKKMTIDNSKKKKNEDDDDDDGTTMTSNDNDDESQQKEKTTSSTSSTTTTSSPAKEEESKKAKMELLETMGGKTALGEGFTKYAIQKFNSSQLGSISAASIEYGKGGFTLVKGPPGTGKTTTLVALLNALHIRQFHQYFDEVRKIAETPTTSTGAKKVALADATKKKPRLLVCAPSNNAVDHVLRKIMEDGFIDSNGRRYNPTIVRIGSGQSETVKNVALETFVSTSMEEAKDITQLNQAIAGFKTELGRIRSDINRLQRRLNALMKAAPWPLSKDWEIRIDAAFEENGKVYFVNHREKTTTFECPPPPEPGETHFAARAMPEYRTFVSQLVKLIERYNKVTSKLERCAIVEKYASSLVSGKVSNQVTDMTRQQLETHTLDSAHIVMTTLGTAGCPALEATSKFEVVVVDEAAQSVEPATLSALQLGSSHAILVGDPQQLPATIFSVSGRNTKYDRSLFQRLEEAGHEVHLLNTQYRMAPEISSFPRRIFYGGYLLDGPNVKDPQYGNPLKSIVSAKFPSFRPFTVFDLDSREERGGTSLSNSSEARFALHLYESLAKNTQYAASKSRIAIITPYSQQVALIKRTFNNKLGPNYHKAVDVNTVDAFQGQEADIVLFSCVRAAGSRGIGFLSDVRRMNVALTRAKAYLFVIARCESIVVNPYWKELVYHAREAHSIISIPMKGGYNEAFPDLNGLKALPPKPKQMIPVAKKRKFTKDRDSDEDGEIK